MKNKFLIYLGFVLLFCSVVSAQQLSLDEIRQNYKSFNYQKVIEFSRVLLNNDSLSKDETIELQTMNAVAYYSLNNESSARKSFIEILKLDRNYSLDPAFISPKIITLFENTKKDFTQIYEEKAEEIVDENKPEEKPVQLTQNYTPDNSFLLKSLILPGWGHLSRNGGAKSWIITVASTITLGSMIYFIIDSNDKEKSYLNETNPVLIQQKYASFNTSYKTRNILIGAYAAIWIFSQLDLLVFDTDNSSTLGISPQLDQQNNLSLSLHVKF